MCSLRLGKIIFSHMEQRIKESFARQGLMQTFGAELTEVVSGSCEIVCEFKAGLSQQHGFFHGGVITSIADSACGYAALTLMPEGAEVVTVEFKINFLKVANTSRLRVVGKVLQSGRSLTVCEGCVYSEDGTLCAKMTATLMAISP